MCESDHTPFSDRPGITELHKTKSNRWHIFTLLQQTCDFSSFSSPVVMGTFLLFCIWSWRLSYKICIISLKWATVIYEVKMLFSICYWQLPVCSRIFLLHSMLGFMNMNLRIHPWNYSPSSTPRLPHFFFALKTKTKTLCKVETQKKSNILLIFWTGKWGTYVSVIASDTTFPTRLSTLKSKSSAIELVE